MVDYIKHVANMNWSVSKSRSANCTRKIGLCTGSALFHYISVYQFRSIAMTCCFGNTLQ